MANEERFEFFKFRPPKTLRSGEELNLKLANLTSIEGYLYEPEEWNWTADEKRKIIGTSFLRCSFSKTRIAGFNFRSCTFKECLLIGSKFVNCEFHNCVFDSCNTHKIQFTNTYIDPNSFLKCLDKRVHQNLGVHLFQNLLRVTRGAEQIEFERDAHFLFLRWKRYQDLYEAKRNWKHGYKSKSCISFWRYILRFLHEYLLGSGVRLSRVIYTFLAMMLSFFICNAIWSKEFGLMDGDQSMTSVLDILYYTVISWTTVGYGDITPTVTLGRIVSAIQSIFGYILFGILVATLFRRIAR